jgi:quercetin dioxygenase-like cupin family protein
MTRDMNAWMTTDRATEVILAEVERVIRVIPEAAPFLADWPQGSERRVCTPTWLNVCDWLECMDPPAMTAGLVAALVASAPKLQWRQTYTAADFGEDFLKRYGWTEFIGLRGPVPSASLACGVLLLAPGLTYPSHAHQAEELYLPLSGAAEWQMGEADFATVQPGQVIHHAPWMPHAVRCGPEPMAALYLWRGGDLAAKSKILG